MVININGEAIKELRKLLEYPPYLIFVFIGAIIVFASLVWENNFFQVWIFFLYAASGSIWRYIEKDIDAGIKKYICVEKEVQDSRQLRKEHMENKKYKTIHLILITMYHIGNIALFFALLYYLNTHINLT